MLGKEKHVLKRKAPYKWMKIYNKKRVDISERDLCVAEVWQVFDALHNTSHE